MSSNLLKVFGVLLGIATVIYAIMIVPPFLQEKQKEQHQASQERLWHSEGKKAGDEMVRQMGVEEKRINALPITRAEKERLKQQMLHRAFDEMRLVQHSDYKKPFSLKTP